MRQHTINNSFTLSGKGLHTGLYINATFMPAEPDTGICIRRVDLKDKPCFEAVADYVANTARGTVLQNGEWGVSTVEHALSALYSLNINNCIIEVDAPEMPILDGSAKLFVEAIQKAGIKQQEAEQKTLVIDKAISYESGNSKIEILPCDHYCVEVNINFASPILNQQTACLNSLDDYISEISSARTFVFVREILPLLQMGLIKGGDLQNAIVIYDQQMSQQDFDQLAAQLQQSSQDASQLRYLCNLHFDNEPARHKLLDIIGDLALTGRHIQGKVIATCPGHSINTAFAKKLRELL